MQRLWRYRDRTGWGPSRATKSRNPKSTSFCWPNTEYILCVRLFQRGYMCSTSSQIQSRLLWNCFSFYSFLYQIVLDSTILCMLASNQSGNYNIITTFSKNIFKLIFVFSEIIHYILNLLQFNHHWICKCGQRWS